MISFGFPGRPYIAIEKDGLGQLQLHVSDGREDEVDVGNFSVDEIEELVTAMEQFCVQIRTEINAKAAREHFGEARVSGNRPTDFDAGTEREPEVCGIEWSSERGLPHVHWCGRRKGHSSAHHLCGMKDCGASRLRQGETEPETCGYKWGSYNSCELAPGHVGRHENGSAWSNTNVIGPLERCGFHWGESGGFHHRCDAWLGHPGDHIDGAAHHA